MKKNKVSLLFIILGLIAAKISFADGTSDSALTLTPEPTASVTELPSFVDKLSSPEVANVIVYTLLGLGLIALVIVLCVKSGSGKTDKKS